MDRKKNTYVQPPEKKKQTPSARTIVNSFSVTRLTFSNHFQHTQTNSSFKLSLSITRIILIVFPELQLLHDLYHLYYSFVNRVVVVAVFKDEACTFNAQLPKTSMRKQKIEVEMKSNVSTIITHTHIRSIKDR